VSDAARSLGELVPEVFFDLIARITPGAVMIALLLLDDPGRGAAAESLGFGLAFPLGLALAYTLGLLLDVGGDLMTDAMRIGWTRITGGDQSDPSNRSNLDLCIRIDTLQEEKPRTASILTKILAERTLARSLTILAFFWFYAEAQRCLVESPADGSKVPVRILGALALLIVLTLVTRRLETHARQRLKSTRGNGG
jgi:hypothetical protein